VQWGLAAYVAEKLGKYSQGRLFKRERPLLDCAVSHAPGFNSPSTPEVATLLLQQGARPNQKYKEYTPWENTLVFLHSNWQSIEKDQHESLQYLAVLELLLRAGANPSAHLMAGNVRFSPLEMRHQLQNELNL